MILYSIPISPCMTAVTAVGVISGVYYAYRLYQDKNRLLDQWRRVGHLKRLYVYPIKSCAPILLNQGECTDLGMRDGWLRDRTLMVVDAESNDFVTARTFPELLQVQPSFRRAMLILKHPHVETIEINLAEIIVTQKPIKASVWGATVSVFDCGDEVNKWFTKLLSQEGMNFRLVYYASTKSRPLVNVPKIFDRCRKSDTGALPDQLAYNLINEASVDDLNTRLNGVQVNETNFRPNFLLSGAEAYDEDNWKYVKIGENIFEVIKPCTRCIMTTVDRETGVMDKRKEPLETLKTYRVAEEPKLRAAMGALPRMGIQMALRSGPGGDAVLNDPIYVAY